MTVDQVATACAIGVVCLPWIIGGTLNLLIQFFTTKPGRHRG